MDRYAFQYCQKMVVFSKEGKRVLLCKRKGERDYEGIFSFIGGKMEVKDRSIIEGLRREKNEEVGRLFKVKIYPTFVTQAFFRKSDGNSMVLPHYYAQHVSGKVKLNEEYSDYQWVGLKDLEKFEPKIPTVPAMVAQLIRLKKIMKNEEYIVL